MIPKIEGNDEAEVLRKMTIYYEENYTACKEIKKEE